MEYVAELQTRTKWKTNEDSLAPNTLVLIKEDYLPPLKWRLGRIIRTIPGKDGRVADIRTSNGVVKWSPAGESVAPHIALLVRAGVMRPRSSPTRANRLYRGLALAATTMYLLQECVYAYQERGDMAKLSRVMFLLLCHVTSLAKQIVFHTDAGRIDAVVAALDEPAFVPGGGEARGLVRAAARRARLLLAGYAGAAALTCLLWVVFPVLDRAAGRPVEFYFWTGLPADSLFIFSVQLAYSYYVTSLVGIANTTMDAFMATILSQCQTQLRILRMNLENLVERAKDESKVTGEDEEKVFMKLFVRCLQHYDKVIEISKLLEDIFGVPILVQFGIGGWILCMAAYKLVSLSVLSIEFASMTLFLMCILTELFLYCYYGNELAVESEQIAGAAYAARWVRLRPAARRALLLLMARARLPLRPTAGRVVALSLDTFLTILKSSYTFYAVLRQTK